jgi:hypothetical protein
MQKEHKKLCEEQCIISKDCVEKCPDCGGKIFYAEGTFFCPVCGFSQENMLSDL